MSKRAEPSASAVLRRALPLAAALALGACSAGWQGEYDDVYVPQTHYERYPIQVGKGTMKMKVPTKSASLSSTQEETVVRFAQQARSTNAGHVVVSRPAGGPHSAAVAQRVSSVLAQEGIAPHAIVDQTYKGGRGAPVVVSFSRHFASSPQCGDWSESLTETGRNEPHPNFGCAQQHNIATLVADPHDFKVPRASTPPDAMRRTKVITDYQAPKDTATPSGDEPISVKEIAN